MTDTTATTASPAPVKRRHGLRILGWILLSLILLLVILYFVATSAAFFKGVLLPRVGKAMNATITVSDASISPFSQVILRDLKVQTTGPEPLLTAAETRARYKLWDILGGKIKVEEVTVDSPVVQIIENPDGTSNLDALLKPTEKKEKAPSTSAKGSSKPAEIDVKQVALKNATIRQVKNHKGGGRDLAELSNVNITLSDLKNGQAGKLSLGATVKVENNPPSPGTNGTLQAKVDGNFTFGLSADLKPTDVKGQAHFLVEQSAGSFGDLATLGANLNCDATPAEIKEVALRFQKGGAELGQVLASGPFDMEKSEGHLTVQVLSIDRQVLNLAGASMGIDFGSTTISSTNQIDLSKAGKMITATGQLDASKFSITRTNQATPPLDLRCVYNVTVNQDEKSALLQTLTITGTQNQQALLRGELTSPMSVAWGTASPGVPDSTLNLTLTNLNLTDWKPFLGEAVTAGSANLNLKVQSQQSGKQLVLDLASQLNGLTMKVGTNQITQASVSLQARGQVAELKKLNLESYRLQLAQQGQEVLLVSGSGQVDTSTLNADLQVTLSATLAKLLQLMPQPDANITSGAVEFKSHITRQQQIQTITGSLALTDLTGRYGNSKFQSFGTKVDLDISLKDKLLEIRKASASLVEGPNAGGSFDVTGSFDTEKKSGQLALKLADLNQNGLRPFLESMLGDKKLVSVSLNGNANATYDPQAASAIKAEIQMTKLLANDPKGQLPATPLEAKLQMDASLDKQVLDLRQLQVTLTPTERAKNELQMTGRVDFSQTNALQGALKLAADSLDVTTYYDLVSKPTPAASPGQTSAPSATGSAPTAAGPQTEPPAQHLPVKDFTADINIGRFYLREIAITNLLATAKIQETHVNLAPIQLSINGAPVKANLDLDLSVPGYQYNVSLTGDKIPLEPLANTFMPDKRGMYKGDVLINSQIKGTGVTGANLQKSLAGQLNFSLTNAIIRIVSPKLKQFLTPVALFLGIPELLNTPLNWVGVHTEMGGGRIDFKELALVSPVFRLETAGVMPIAEVLTNSPFQNWPVNLYLSRALAEKTRLVSSSTPQADPYAKLPNFLRVAGTLGDPKAQIDKTALAGTVLEKFGGQIPGLNGKTGGLLQGLGGLLSGSQPAVTNQSSTTNTNQPAATNKAAPLNFLDLLKKKK